MFSFSYSAPKFSFSSFGSKSCGFDRITDYSCSTSKHSFFGRDADGDRCGSERSHSWEHKTAWSHDKDDRDDETCGKSWSKSWSDRWDHHHDDARDDDTGCDFFGGEDDDDCGDDGKQTEVDLPVCDEPEEDIIVEEPDLPVCDLPGDILIPDAKEEEEEEDAYDYGDDAEDDDEDEMADVPVTGEDLPSDEVAARVAAQALLKANDNAAFKDDEDEIAEEDDFADDADFF
jgi:hypothetical protein